MVEAIVTDFSGVLLFPKDKSYKGKLNKLHKELFEKEDYNIWDYFQLNKPLLDFYRKLSESFNLYVFTTEYIQEYPPLKERIKGIFKKIFIATELEIKKNEKEAYLVLAKKLVLSPNQILYIDDLSTNIEIAKTAGINAILYSANGQIIRDIKKEIEDI